MLLTLDRDIARNLSILDLSLQGVAEALTDPGINLATPSVRHHALFDRSADAEDLGSILVLDPRGKVVEDSTSIEPHPLDLEDRDYFRIHRERPDAGVFVSRPFRSRLAGGDLRISISRRLSTPDGAFAGVVEGALRINYFRRLFEKLDLGPGGTITLFRSDGRVLVRYPFSENDIDRDLSQGESFRHFVLSKQGQYTARASIDRIERLYTYKHISNLPLILTVNLATADIFAPWWQKALVIGPVLGLLCAAAVASCLLFRREVLRRGQAEDALAVAADKLTVIAATDGLTGLANRRTFEAEFDRAFRRAVRQGTSLAVIMFDADYFKSFNDHYGHLSGDDALRTIAECMAANLRRPDDVAARFGGEEFVALLPGSDMIAATVIGERIRKAIEDRSITHSGSPLGRVTVSVGVAAAAPFAHDDIRELIKTADQSLYAAKAAGRNCVRSRDMPGSPNVLGFCAPSMGKTVES